MTRWTALGPIRRDGRGEDGIVLVLVALSLTLIVGMAALAIDLGTAYSASRQMQNAADDAALAATRVLQCYDVVSNTSSPLYNPALASQYGCPTGAAAYSAAQVATTASSVAQSDNGAQVESCEIISYYGLLPTPPYYTVVDPSCTDSAWTTNALADGVFVTASTTETTAFGKAVGTNQLSQLRQGAATVQQLIGVGPLNSIILVCAGFNPGTQQVDATTGTKVPSLVNYDPVTQQYSLNTTMATSTSGGQYNGPVYNPNYSPSDGSGVGQPALLLHNTHIDTCNLTSQGWKGIGNAGTLPAWFQVTTGDRAGPTRVAVAGQPGCNAADLSQDPTGCVLVLPICTDSNSGAGSNGSMYCVAWGAFELLSSGVNNQTLGFLGAATVSSGQTASGPPTSSNVEVVQLVQ
jgi:Flp pilus assembly protein TadG